LPLQTFWLESLPAELFLLKSFAHEAEYAGETRRHSSGIDQRWTLLREDDDANAPVIRPRRRSPEVSARRTLAPVSCPGRPHRTRVMLPAEFPPRHLLENRHAFEAALDISRHLLAADARRPR
jgi:hypothetical protein